MVGLTFNNQDHSTVGVPHSSGSKWAVQVKGAAILAKCGGDLGCAYNGDFSTEIYNVSRLISARNSPLEEEWIIVEAANDLRAWVALRYAWGGLNETASSLQEGVMGSANHSFRLVPNDPEAPLILYAGDATEFGSIEKFTSSVLAASLTVTNKVNDTKLVRFIPPGGLPRLDFPWSRSKATLHMPSVGGVPVSATPSMTYEGPFMESTLGEETVRISSGATAGDLSFIYDFATDTVRGPVTAEAAPALRPRSPGSRLPFAGASALEQH